VVNSVEECADRMLTLLKNPTQTKEMGQAAREHVRRNFLSTRHLANYLRLFSRIQSA
jgi:trehalose synthase